MISFDEDIKYPYATVQKVADAAEHLYADSDGLPDPEEVSKLSGVPLVMVIGITKTVKFKALMERRGIRWTSNTAVLSQLTSEQIIGINVVLTPDTRKSVEKRLKDAGLDYSQWRNWMKDPKFRKTVDQLSEKYLNENMVLAHRALVDKAVGGNVPALRLFYEVSGRYSQNNQEQSNLVQIIQMLLEVLTRRVSDPVILRDINQDFSAILEGRIPEGIGTIPANYVEGETIGKLHGEGRNLPA